MTWRLQRRDCWHRSTSDYPKKKKKLEDQGTSLYKVYIYRVWLFCLISAITWSNSAVGNLIVDWNNFCRAVRPHRAHNLLEVQNCGHRTCGPEYAHRCSLYELKRAWFRFVFLEHTLS
jgi:hypothetical protein